MSDGLKHDLDLFGLMLYWENQANQLEEKLAEATARADALEARLERIGDLPRFNLESDTQSDDGTHVDAFDLHEILEEMLLEPPEDKP